MKIDFLMILWFFPTALLIHELEEWNILNWYSKYFAEMPTDKSHTSTRFFLIFISVVCFIWTGAAVGTQNEQAAVIIMLPFLAIVIQNILQHIYWCVLFKSIGPGFLSAIFLLLPVSVYILFIGLKDRLIPWWTLVILSIYWVMGTRETILAKNRMTKSFKKINAFSNYMLKKLRILP